MTKVALGTITNLAATAGDTQVTLNWTAASGATSQQPRFATASGGPWTNFGAALSGTATTVTVTGLTNGTLYFFTVTATDGATTTTSNEVSATPKLPAPGAITNLAVGTVTATSVALSWTPATGAATHYIMRRLKPTFTPNNLPGIRLWLDAQNEAERRALATNQSALLDLWVDSSTNAANFEQAGANPKPLLIHDGTRWVVRFDGTDDCMMAISTKLGMLRNVPGATVIAGVRTNLTVLVIASVSTGGAAGSARATLNRNNLTANTRTGGRRLDADAFSAVDSPNNAFASGAWGIQSSHDIVRGRAGCRGP